MLGYPKEPRNEPKTAVRKASVEHRPPGVILGTRLFGCQWFIYQFINVPFHRVDRHRVNPDDI